MVGLRRGHHVGLIPTVISLSDFACKKIGSASKQAMIIDNTVRRLYYLCYDVWLHVQILHVCSAVFCSPSKIGSAKVGTKAAHTAKTETRQRRLVVANIYTQMREGRGYEISSTLRLNTRGRGRDVKTRRELVICMHLGGQVTWRCEPAHIACPDLHFLSLRSVHM